MGLQGRLIKVAIGKWRLHWGRRGTQNTTKGGRLRGFDAFSGFSTTLVQQRQNNAQNDFCSKSGYELPTSRARRCNLEWYSSIIKYYDNASCMWYIEHFIITNVNDTLPGDNSVNNYVLVAWRDRRLVAINEIFTHKRKRKKPRYSLSTFFTMLPSSGRTGRECGAWAWRSARWCMTVWAASAVSSKAEWTRGHKIWSIYGRMHLPWPMV